MTITPSDLDLHARWLRNEPDGRRLIKPNADLRYVHLHGANLRGANLRWANLRRANLSEADLSGANLHSADLCDANLRDADLRGADLCGANLRGANLRDADLRGTIGLPIAADAAQRLRAVAQAALQPGALKMNNWHCETAHCISGWAIHQAGELGRIMESMMGPHVAGLLLLGVEAAEHFYDSDAKATEYLQSVLSESR